VNENVTGCPQFGNCAVPKVLSYGCGVTPVSMNMFAGAKEYVSSKTSQVIVT
jgi:hypothetical protein